MIKSYSILDKYEKEAVIEFLSKEDSIKKSIENIDEEFNEEIYDYGVGALFYFNKNKVIGKAYVVLEVARVLHTGFIHSVDILEEAENKGEILKQLINQGVLLAKKYDAREIKLGIRNENIVKIAETIGLYKNYSAFIMTLEDRKIREEPLKLIKLTNKNKEDYIKIYNLSFGDMPHGTFVELSDINKFLIENKKEEERFIVTDKNGEHIGFIECSIENCEGFFDIGLRREYRGQGLGKRLLETAINYMNNKDVNKISLTVIEKNTRAFEMYKKRGFKIESLLSYWYEIIKGDEENEI
ncbi:GNAT family N-acetyltransferase [Clostridium carnis]